MSSTMIIKGDAADPNTISRLARKSMTYDGGAGSGAIGTVGLFTVTGAVLVERITPRCTVDLAGATATLALGVTGNTAGMIAATTATSIDANLLWFSASPATGSAAVPAALTNVAVAANIINTIAVANVTGGAIVYEVAWKPLSADGNLVAA